MANHLEIGLDTVIQEAVKREAADIIFTHNCPPALKIEGRLVQLDEYEILNDIHLQSLAKEIMNAEKTKVLEVERQVDLAYALGETRFRVNIFFQRGHLTIVMRYVRNNIRTIDDLGLPEVMRDIVSNDNGLILIVGPTGSGKSTTLAAMLEEVNSTSAEHIITIEDPIEYVYENKKSIIEQRELGTDTLNFASALRSALREAPDVILLGEMRDLESISAAITVAETGHLVLSTVHANSAAGTIDRIIDIFPAGYKDQVRIQLSDVLLGVFNQRLVPAANGSGSVAIVETMLATSAVRNAIRTSNSAQLENIIQTSASDGMYLLDDLLLKAAKEGSITKENALSYASNRVEMKKALGTV